jgi:hypothetical protein
MFKSLCAHRVRQQHIVELGVIEDNTQPSSKLIEAVGHGQYLQTISRRSVGQGVRWEEGRRLGMAHILLQALVASAVPHHSPQSWGLHVSASQIECQDSA